MNQDEMPREWFLYKSVREDADTLTAVPRRNDPQDQYPNMITVIEKSAFDRLKAENDLLNKMVSEWATRAAQHCANTDRVKMHAEAMARALYDADRRTPGQRKALAAYRKDFPTTPKK